MNVCIIHRNCMAKFIWATEAFMFIRIIMPFLRGHSKSMLIRHFFWGQGVWRFYRNYLIIFHIPKIFQKIFPKKMLYALCFWYHLDCSNLNEEKFLYWERIWDVDLSAKRIIIVNVVVVVASTRHLYHVVCVDFPYTTLASKFLPWKKRQIIYLKLDL